MAQETLAWWLWLYSTDEFTLCDSNSEVALNQLPAAAFQNIGGVDYITSAWTRIAVKKGEPLKKKLSGIAQIQTYEFPITPFIFEDEMTELEAILTALKGRWKYLCMDGYDTAPITTNVYPYRIHTVEKCVALHPENIEYEPAGDDEYGIKLITIKPEKRLPIL